MIPRGPEGPGGNKGAATKLHAVHELNNRSKVSERASLRSLVYILVPASVNRFVPHHPHAILAFVWNLPALLYGNTAQDGMYERGG
jgi:hypothetical protein